MSNRPTPKRRTLLIAAGAAFVGFTLNACGPILTPPYSPENGLKERGLERCDGSGDHTWPHCYKVYAAPASLQQRSQLA